MKILMFFVYFTVFASSITIDKLQELMVDKKYTVQGIFYKYNFANVESAWDFVYVSSNVFYQLKGANITSNNVFGWKIIDKVIVSVPSFYFVYLSDIDEDNQTKYDWVAINKTASTIYKLNGSTSSGYFSWSDNLSKLSFSFSEANKKVTFHKSINGGGSTGDGKLPDLPDSPDLPDILRDVTNSNISGGSSNKDGEDTKDDKNKDKDKDGEGDKDDKSSGKTDDNKDSNGNKNDTSNCTQFAGEEKTSCLEYYEEVKKFPKTPACNDNIQCMQHYKKQNLVDCTTFKVPDSSPPGPGECDKWEP